MLLPSFGIAQLPLPPDSKLQALLSLFSQLLTSFESLFNFPSLPSHLKYSFLHVLLFPYIHGYSSASVLSARCSATKATRSFAIACGGPGQDLEMDTLPCFYCSQKNTSLCQLGAVLTTKNINLICMRTVSEFEPVFLRQKICQAQIVQLPASICCFIVF